MIKLSKLSMFILILFFTSILSFKSFAYTSAFINNTTMVNIVEPQNALISINDGQILSDSKGISITNHTSDMLTVNANFNNQEGISVAQVENPFNLLSGETREIPVKIIKAEDKTKTEAENKIYKLYANITCTWDNKGSRANINTFVYVK